MAQNPNPNPKPSQHKTTHNKLNHDQSSLAPTPKLEKPQPSKASDKRKRKRTVRAKRGYKVKVLNQPMTTTTAPMPVTTSTQIQTTGFTATIIPVTVHKPAAGQFPEASCPTVRSSVQSPPPLEAIPKGPIRQGTPWSNAGSTSENLFETRKDWPIPPTQSLTPRQAAKNCTCRPHLSTCEEDREHEEDWDGNLQNPSGMLPQNGHQPQPQSYQHAQPQHPSHQMFNRILSAHSPKTFSTPATTAEQPAVI